jgi:bacterioferritin-associated ferredoxin
MIVCHCRNISDHDIRAAVAWMRASDPMTIVTPGKVYHALGQRADCGGCMPLFLDTMRQTDGFQVPHLKRSVPSQTEATEKEAGDEGRQEGHRLSERRASV